MMLIEDTQVPEAALPLDAFKAHLRMGTGFAEDNLQDAVLASFLRAALAAVEARTGKALIARGFSWTLTRWRVLDSEVLPLAPVSAIDGVTLIDRFGVETPLDTGDFSLLEDAQRPRVCAVVGAMPSIASGGKTVITFTAGYAADWDGLPNDLAQAVLLLAAHYYEYRDETSLARGCMPFGVQSLLERYRPVRLFSGDAS
ncbi:MAG: head-tail connector protein [Pseudomonadota bacterium]